MKTRYTWNDSKRQINLSKHGLDLRDGWKVLESRYRLGIESPRNHEPRRQVFAYVYDVLTVLTLVYAQGEDTIHFNSLRRASRKEREAFDEWLDNEDLQP